MTDSSSRTSRWTGTRMLVGPLLLAAVAAAVVGGLLLTSPYHVFASHGSTTPSYAIDTVIADNIYTFELNGSTVTQNEINVGSVTPCVKVTSLGSAFSPHKFDVVGKTFSDATSIDFRLNHSSALVINSFDGSPFSDSVTDVGFMNLFVDPSSSARPPFIDAPNIGATTSFYAQVYVGDRTFAKSPDHPHTHSVSEPYEVNAEWVVLARVNFYFASGTSEGLYGLDLSNSPAPGASYTSLNDETTDATTIVDAPDNQLFDGQIALDLSGGTTVDCPGPQPTQPPTEQTAAPSATAPSSRTPTPRPPTPADGGAGGGVLTEQQIEELTEETIAGLIEEAKAGQTSLDAVLDTLIAGGSTNVLAICADENANPLANVDITFKIDQQPGSDSNLDGQAEVTKTTNADGVAETTLNVGHTSGEIVVSASAEECNSETIIVTVEAAAGGPAPAGDAAIGDDDGGSGGSPWQIAVYAAVVAVALAGGAGLVWRWRRRRLR